MIDAPLALAFTAGLVATVNPCGFAMLPAYLAWLIGVEGSERSMPVAERLARALGFSGLMSVALVTVFAVAGTLVTAGALLVIDVVPWLAIVVGIALTAAGVAMMRGWKPTFSPPMRSTGITSRGVGSVLLFGISYAVASLSCTLPVFLAVVAGTVTSENLVSGVATFVAYGLGMSLALVSITVVVAFSRGALVRRLRRASRHVDRAAAVLLIVAGVYISAYWALTLFTAPGSGRVSLPFGVDPVGLVEQMSTWAVNNVESFAVPVSVVLGGIVLAAVWVALERRGPGPPAGDEDGRDRMTGTAVPRR